MTSPTLSSRALDRAPYDALRDAFADERCVILDGASATTPYAGDGDRAHGLRALVCEPGAVLERHRRYADAGCDVLTTSTWGLAAALGDPESWIWEGARDPAHWMDVAARAIRLARRAIAERGRSGDVAVAFSIDGGVDGPDGAETISLLRRVFKTEPPDLVIVEALTAVRPTLYETVEALVATGLPVWLSFRRCTDGLCGVYGQHWGGPEGDAFGRAARRFEAMGVGALLVGCVPPDHVDGMVAGLRAFTGMPLGVHPNLGYLTSEGWRSPDADHHDLALRWREQGAQIVGGCCGVGPEQIAAAAAALQDTAPGVAEPLEPAVPDPREPWRDESGRELYPLALPELVTRGEVFVPTQGSYLVWRHLFRAGVGDGRRCLDVGCGSGLQTVQLALNGAEHVHAIDLDPDAVDVTLTNAFRNGVAGRVSAAAVDLHPWVPPERYDVIVASLYQRPVDPLDAAGGDYWGRTAVDRLLALLPEALDAEGVAYVLQLSILSQAQTDELLARHGLRARVVDFAFLPFTERFHRSAEQIARVERQSDAYHLQVAGADVAVAYLLEITHDNTNHKETDVLY